MSIGIRGTLLDLERVFLSSVSFFTCLLGLDLDPCDDVEGAVGVGSKDLEEEESLVNDLERDLSVFPDD